MDYFRRIYGVNDRQIDVPAYDEDIDQISISSVEELVVFKIWKRVDPRMTNRKIPKSHGPIWLLYSFF